MEQDELSTEKIASTATNWLSTALSVPLVWPKTTVLACLAVIALSTSFWVAPLLRSDKPPPLNDRLLSRMVRDAEQADAELRSRAGMPLERDPQSRGVFEMMRDPPKVSESEP